MRIEHKDNVTELQLNHAGLGMTFKKIMDHRLKETDDFRDSVVRAVIEFNDLVELRDFIGALSEFENACRNNIGNFERSND